MLLGFLALSPQERLFEIAELCLLKGGTQTECQTYCLIISFRREVNVGATHSNRDEVSERSMSFTTVASHGTPGKTVFKLKGHRDRYEAVDGTMLGGDVA